MVKSMHADILVWLCLLIALCVLGITVAALRSDSRRFRRRLAGEEAARRQWLHALADASFDGLLIHRQGMILQMNRSLVRMLGAREREWLGQHFANLARPDQVAALRAELEAPQPQLVEFSLVRTNKSEVAVEIFSHNIEFEGLPATVTAIRDISQRLADAARIARLTHYDGLTGLANRTLFGEMLAAAIARNDHSSGTTTVVTLDLDQFKQMNERLGRAGGDLLLQQVAVRIGAMVSKEDALARLGGDKFALLMTSAGAPNRALSLGGQLAAAFGEPFIIEGRLVKQALSIGIAVYPDHAADADGLMKASAFALSQAQRAGGGVAHMFSHDEIRIARQEEARSGQSDVQRLADDLRVAVRRGEMRLVYQPVFRTAELTPIGFEALARWNHPVEGLIGPERFIPVADAAGLNQEIGCYLLERACEAAQHAGGMRMAVNLSSVQLRDVNLAARIGAILRKTGLRPELLEVEVAEGLLVENPGGARPALQALRALGVGVALDDFGTGYSSLNSLCDLPFSRLKIDRRFVQQLGRDDNAEAIVNAILTLASNLRVEVTAVGVENAAQLDYLRRRGCHFVQGNLLGQPTARAMAPAPLALAAPSARPALVVARG
jgi:diguanylate cyclase